MSNANKEKITKYADEIDTGWIDKQALVEERRERAADKEAKAAADSKFKIDTFEAEGHIVPDFDEIYDTNDKGRSKLNVSSLEQWIVNKSDEHFVSFDQGKTLYIYKDGVYIPGGLGWLKTCLYLCNKAVGMTPTKEAEIINLIGYHCMHDREDADKRLTVLNNYTLNTDTCEITQHTSKHIALSKLGIDYDPAATCPEWTEFVDFALADEDKDTLQELFGYCLTRSYKHQVAFFNLGSGKNGKGVMTRTLRAMLGNENCSAVPMQDVGARFFTANLHNKYANISDDTSPRALCDTAMYKMLTGGDRIRAEDKNKDAYDFTNHAKIISSMNELMKTDDQSDAFFRRFVLIRFDNRPTPERIKEKTGFEDTIVASEMSGVLNWAIEGLKRLNERGIFKFTLDHDEPSLRRIWNHEADRPEAFINECCERGGFIEPGTFHHAYTRWHEEKYGVPPREEQGDITKAHAKYGFGKGTRNTYSNSYLWDDRKAIKGYTGICLKNTVGNYSVYPDYVDAHWHEIMGSQSINNEHLNNEEHLNNDGQIGDTVDKMRDAVKIALRKIKGDPTGFITANEISLASQGRLSVPMVEDMLKQDAEALGLRFTGNGWCGN